MFESNRLWLGTKCRASPLRRCLLDCLWDCSICKTRQWKWPHPLQFCRWEISLGSRGTDDYTQIGIVSRCFSCQNESDVTRRMSVEIWQHSVLVRLQSCPQIYQEQRDKRFYLFVAKCLAAIHDVSEPSQYNFVPTSINLADDASRRLTVKELLKREVWFRGPKFLWESETS